MKINLKDQVAIVTGAGAGFGAAHAIALAERGARDGETIPESGGFQYQYEVDRALATSQLSGSSKQ